MARWLQLLGGLLVALAATAGETIALVPGPTEELPAAGLRLRPFRDFTNRPLPALEARLYENDQTRERVEGYRPADLWRHDQHVALFVGDKGTLAIAFLRHPPPPRDLPRINEEHVLLADYRRAMGEPRTEWDTPAIIEWVRYATGRDVTATTAALPDFRTDYAYLACQLEGQAANRRSVVVVQLPYGRQQRHFLALDFNASYGVEVRNLRTAMAGLVNSLRLARPAEDDKAPAAALQQRLPEPAPGAAANPELAAARQRVIANLRNLPDWWYVETPNYLIASNIEKRQRRLVDALQTDLELLRPAYARLLPALRPVREVSVVRLFAQRQEYLDYLDEDASWTGGVWMPAKKELVISPLDLDNAKEEREKLLSVVYHEAFHQYLYYALDHRQPPIWFNEGHAGYFETAKLDRGRGTLELTENERLVPILERLLARHGDDLAAMLRLDPHGFYAEGREERYALAWGLVWFLRQAAPQLPAERRYDQVCNLTMELVGSGITEPAAIADAIAQQVDLRRLQRDFRAFWDDKTARRKAARLNLFKPAK
jgi:hypothetical protein